MTAKLVEQHLYVEITPVEGPEGPRPHPVRDGRFDPGRIYRVLGVCERQEAGDPHLMLANPQREIWFISHRHVRAWGILTGDAFSLPRCDDSLSERNADNLTRTTGPGCLTGRLVQC